MVAAVLTACTTTADVSKQALQPTEIRLSLYMGSFLAIDGTSHGRAGNFLLDTAGGITVVTPDFAQAIGCKPWGQITGFRMRGERVDTKRCDDVMLEPSGVSLTSPSAGVWDLASLFPKNAPPLAGSIALDAFADRIVTLDIAHMRLLIETPASLARRIRGATEVAVRFARDAGA